MNNNLITLGNKYNYLEDKYDYLIVGSGLYGSVCAYELHKAGKKVLVLERKDNIGGAISTCTRNKIVIHQHGPHIFHTNNKSTWDYINQFGEFNNFINSPIAIYNDTVYSLPFNMYTFEKIYKCKNPNNIKKLIKNDTDKIDKDNITNLREKAISLVGEPVYNILIKGYTEKQWGKSCTELPPEIIERLPLRFTYDNRYYNDKYQGVPIRGYDYIIYNMLKDISIAWTDFLRNCDYWYNKADKIIYTGAIDEYYEYKYGVLDYRSLIFETHFIEDCENYQGNAVVNYTDRSTDYTRIIEHKWFNFGKDYNGKETNNTVITYEYPIDRQIGSYPYYPINDLKNKELYAEYRELAKKDPKVIFGGRLAEYKYYDMDDTIEAALKTVEKELS